MPARILKSATWRRFVAEHLFAYLAGLAAVIVLVSVVFARDELATAMRSLDVRWMAPVLALTLFNYGLRFWKWELLLRASAIDVPRAANARLYFACLAMVVTPARLGELFKIVFLRKLHGVPTSKAIPPLVLERATDALGVLALIAVQPFDGAMAVGAVTGVIGLLVLLGAVLAHPRWRGILLALGARLPFVRARLERTEQLLDGHAALLRPSHLAPALVLSVLAWWAEAVGLALVCRALGSPIDVLDATWIYAASTLLGNLTFLPGGLVGTEASLLALLGRVGVQDSVGIGATALVRGATLWFAVALGLLVTVVFRRSLRWSEVTAEAATDPPG